MELNIKGGHLAGAPYTPLRFELPGGDMSPARRAVMHDQWIVRALKSASTGVSPITAGRNTIPQQVG